MYAMAKVYVHYLIPVYVTVHILVWSVPILYVLDIIAQIPTYALAMVTVQILMYVLVMLATAVQHVMQ
jgi:hypothetical protein